MVLRMALPVVDSRIYPTMFSSYLGIESKAQQSVTHDYGLDLLCVFSSCQLHVDIVVACQPTLRNKIRVPLAAVSRHVYNKRMLELPTE